MVKDYKLLIELEHIHKEKMLSTEKQNIIQCGYKFQIVHTEF